MMVCVNVHGKLLWSMKSWLLPFDRQFWVRCHIFFTAQGFCWFYIGLCWVDCHSIAKFIIEFCIWPAVYCTTPGFIRTLPVFTFKRPVTSPPKNGGTRVLEPEWVEKWLLLSVCCAIVDTRERSLSRETKHPDGWERSGVRLLSTLHYRLSSEN